VTRPDPAARLEHAIYLYGLAAMIGIMVASTIVTYAQDAPVMWPAAAEEPSR